MKIAVEGCCHGELNKIYETLLLAEQKQGIKIDLLICCGDFQAVRNEHDLESMAVPDKYKSLQSFHEYYSGEKSAPILTLFIGGNHEASNYLRELAYGGWAAPNIYYLGYVGVIRYGGVRIAGLSGIYNRHNYNKNHFECPPYDRSTVRSAYHVRSCDVFRLEQLSGDIDVMVSHDWPQGIEHYGDTQQLLRWKPHFRDDISTHSLGSPPAMNLLKHHRPSYWFSAHLHVKFPALYPHNSGQSSSDSNWRSPEGQSPKGHSDSKRFTRFLALDKCLPRRSFLQILDVPAHDGCEKPYKLTFDPEWLAILRSTEHLMCNSYWTRPRESFTPSTDELLHIEHTLFGGDLTIPDNFVQTAPPQGKSPAHGESPNQVYDNPQTVSFCKTLKLPSQFSSSKGEPMLSPHNPDEISLDDSIPMDSHNPDEIVLDDVSTGDDVGWCIDTSGATSTRSSLTLPPPTSKSCDMSGDQEKPHGMDESLSHEITETQSHDIKETSSCEQSMSHDSEKTNSEAEVVGVVKIKRRNEAIYVTPQEESD